MASMGFVQGLLRRLFEPTPTSPAELLALWEIHADTIITTHGHYLRGLELLGIDSEHVPASELAQAVEQLYLAMKSSDFPERTFLQFLVVSHSDYQDVFERFESAAPPSDPILAHQRHQRLKFLKAGNLRRHSLYAFCGHLASRGRRPFSPYSLAVHEQRADEAGRLQQSLMQALTRAGVPARPLTDSDLHGLFFRTLNPHVEPALSLQHHDTELADDVLETHPILAPLSVREQLMHSPVYWADDHVRLGRAYAKVLTLKVLPEDETKFPLWEMLLHLDFDFRLSYNVYILDQARTHRAFRGRRRIDKAAADLNQTLPNEERAQAVDDGHAVGRLMARTRQRYVTLGAQVVIFGDSLDEVERRVDAFLGYTKVHGLGFFEETGAHHTEFCKSCPGMGVDFDRWRLASSNNAVDLMPLSGSIHGDRRPVFLMHTARRELYSYDPMEPSRPNWNALVVGASGSGKSVFTNMLITTAMLSNVSQGRVLVVDYAGEEHSSYLMVSRLFGGKYVPFLSRAGAARINPFPHPSAVFDDSNEPIQEALAPVVTLTDTLLNNTGDDKDSLAFRQIVERAVVDLYRQASDYAPTYDDLLGVLQGYRGHRDVTQDRLTLVLELLEGFLRGPSARFFNRRSDDSTDNSTDDRFLILDLFGVESLPPNVREAMTFLACSYLKDIAFSRRYKDHPKYIVLDECARHLKLGMMRSLIETLYCTARKHKTSVWSVSQFYDQFVESSVARTITTNSTTSLLLSHREASQAVRATVMDDFGMNARERYLFEGLNTAKGLGGYSEALLRTTVYDPTRKGNARRVTTKVRVELSPFDYELSTSDTDDRRLQREFMRCNPQVPLHELLDAIAARKLEATKSPVRVQHKEAAA